MPSKREERRQRAAEHRDEQVRAKRQRRWRSRAAFAAGALALVVLGFLATRRPKDGEERNGQVWSAAHGHWHDKP